MNAVRLQVWARRHLTLTIVALLALFGLLAGGIVGARAMLASPSSDTTTAGDTSSSGGASGNGTNNVAAGVNTKDGRTLYAIALKIVPTNADTVDATNAAVAVSSCTDCTTVAIAFEGILLAGSPSTFDPTNLALAENVNCSGCTTFADAYQQVVQHSSRVRITGAGRQEVARIRQDLDSLRHESLSLDEMASRVHADEAAFANVLLNDVVPIGHYPPATSSDSPAATDSPSSDASASSPSSTPTSSDSPSASATSSSSSDSPTPSSTTSP